MARSCSTHPCSIDPNSALRRASACQIITIQPSRFRISRTATVVNRCSSALQHKAFTKPYRKHHQHGPIARACAQAGNVHPTIGRSTAALLPYSRASAGATPAAHRDRSRAPGPAFPDRPGMGTRMLHWRGGNARQRTPGPLLKQAKPRVPLN